MSLNFFNVNIGRWEPFVEPFSFELVTNHEVAKQEQTIQADFSTTINANFTEKLIENLSLSLRSWQICLEDYRKFEKDTDLTKSQFSAEDFEFEANRISAS